MSRQYELGERSGRIWGSPAVAGAAAAVAVAGELVLGDVYRAYLSLYATNAAGVAHATKILNELDGSQARTGQREVLHLRAGDLRVRA